jgi:uncharacterized Zn finger protein
MKTPCCGYEIDNARPPVMWNEFNGVVQCHNCGHVYVPRKDNNLEELAIQIFLSRTSNPKLLSAVKTKTTLTDAERHQRALDRAARALIDARALLEALQAAR